MIIRVTKLIFVFAMALFALVTVINNINDYFVSLKMVETVVTMQTIFPNSTLTYRALFNPTMHHVALITIIIMELLTGLFCLFGYFGMQKSLRKSAKEFNRSKKLAIIGLSIGFLGWQVLFVTIGGEWFAMWMSQTAAQAMHAAFEIFITYLAVLIYIVHKDEELEI